MIKYFLTALLLLFAFHTAFSQCKIALDVVDEFDTTRIIASQPFNIGMLVATGNVAENLQGKEYVEEGKLIFSFANEHKIRSFFLTIGVVERRFYMIEPEFNVMLMFADGNIVRLLNVPDQPEFDRNILMWKYVHTCVVPVEIFQMMKYTPVEKIRIVYKDYKQTLVLEDKQQKQLLEAVRCVEERLAKLEGDKP